MKKWVITMVTVMLLCVPSCLAAEGLSFQEVDELWSRAEDYGVAQGEELDEGLSNLFSDALFAH